MKTLGVYTKDFSLIHDILKTLKKRKLAYVLLSSPNNIPKKINVVLTSKEESSNDKHNLGADKTQMLVSIGTLRTLSLEKGREYALDDLGRNKALLLLDNSAIFLVNQNSEEKEVLKLELLGPLSDTRLFHRYHLAIACGMMDDETLTAVQYGNVLSVAPFHEAKIYLEGQPQARAKVHLVAGRLMVKVEDE